MARGWSYGPWDWSANRWSRYESPAWFTIGFAGRSEPPASTESWGVAVSSVETLLLPTRMK